MRTLLVIGALGALAAVVDLLPDIARERIEARGLRAEPAGLVASAQRGDLDAVRLYLRAGIDPDAVADGYTALMHAAEQGNIPMLEALLAAGAEPDFKGKYLIVTPPGLQNPRPSATPLAVAIRAGQVESVRALVRARAHERGAEGITALTAAAVAGRIDLVEVLLDGGVSPDEALASAVGAGQLAVARRLVQGGARLDRSGVAPALGTLREAARAGDADRVQLLLDAGADPRQDAGLALGAALGDRPDVVRALVRAGAPVDIDTAAAAALLLAQADGRGRGLEALLGEAQARPGVSGPVWTTLARATAPPAPPVDELWRELGLPPEDVAELVLLTAAGRGEVAALRAALQTGADPDVEDWQQESALGRAVRGGHADAVRVLVQAGARRPAAPPAAAPDVVLALGAAATGGRRGPPGALRDGPLRPLESPLVTAIERGDVPRVREIVAAGRDATLEGDPSGTTALMLAAWWGDAESVRALRAAGADPRARDRRGASAADYARTRRALEHPVARKLAYGDVVRALETAAPAAATAP